MPWHTRLTNTLLRRRAVDRDADDELAFHLEQLIADQVAAGMSPSEARRAALLRFGSPARLREETREADSLVWLDNLLRDARFASRSLRQRPGLALTAILSLSLGIGATSAIFSVVDAVLLRPLPYPDPDRLLSIQESIRGQALGGNPARLADWQRQIPAFAALTGLYWEGVVLTGRGDPRRLNVRRSIGPVDAVFGLTPLHGRHYREWSEDEVVLSHRTWQNHFGGDLGVLGQTLILSQKPYTVVGIMPPTPSDGHTGELYASAPLAFRSPDRSGNWLDLIARLAPGTTIERANLELTTVAARLSAQYPATETALKAHARPLLDAATGSARQPLWLLFATIGAVFLIVCANLASLLLVRSAERQREFAVRAALGAGHATLLRLQLLESLWLGLLGGLGGLLLSWWGVDLLKKVLPEDLPRLDLVALDGRVALFGLSLSILAGLFCGGLASFGLRLREVDLLRDGVRATRRTWLRPAFVLLQVVLSTLLLAAAARFTESLLHHLEKPLGFRPDGLIALTYSFPWDTDQQKLHSTFRRTLDHVAALPGVESVGFVDALPLLGSTQSNNIEIPGRDLVPALRDLPVSRRAISESYFATLGLPLQAGRVFARREKDLGECVVNAAFVRTFFPGQNPIGRTFTFDTKRAAGRAPRWLTIVGVVADLRQEYQQAQAVAEAFVPFETTYWPLAKFVIRPTGDPLPLLNSIRQELRRVDPNLPIETLRPLSEEMRAASADSRSLTGLLGSFAVTALLVAAIGLYGLLAGEVVTRRREIGIRLALGAAPAAILASIVRRGVSLVCLGLLAGLLLTYPALQWLATHFSAVDRSPLGAVAVATLVMLAVALVASALPARRAARVDPAIALRHE